MSKALETSSTHSKRGMALVMGARHSARFNSWLPYLLLLKSRFYSERRDTERGLPFTGSLPK